MAPLEWRSNGKKVKCQNPNTQSNPKSKCQISVKILSIKLIGPLLAPTSGEGFESSGFGI
jgi:hypothetical protein